MAWDEIKFKISADMDFGNAINQVKAIKDGIGELKDSITDMPNVSKILDNSLERTASVATSLSEKLERLQAGKYKSDTERSSLEKSISNDVSELNTMRSLQTGRGDFSVSLAKSWFGGLPSAVQKELDSVMPKVASIIKTRTSSISGGSKLFTGRTQTEIASQAIQDPEIKAVASKHLKSQMSQNQLKQLIEDMIPHIVPANRLNGYQIKRYGSVLQNEATALAKGNILDLFPQSYRSAYQNKGYEKRSYNAEQGEMVLSQEAIKELNQMLATRPIMAKAAIESGIGRRNSRGILETKKEISRQEWENYRGALYDELITRVSGYGKGKISPYSSIKADTDKLVSRLTSSTSGETMTGMHDIEKYENPHFWSAKTGSNRYTQIRNEGRRAIDEYVVTKYSPFLKKDNGKEVSPQEVMISESHNTRLLGRGKWKNNDDVSDTIALISLAGYDPKDKKQEEQLLDLYRNGKTINGKQYIAQSTHGKGDDQVIRMIEKSAYDRVAEQENAWARTRKINGTYWGGFNDAEIQRKINSSETPITAKDWGKHFEMLNKAWTPSSDVGLDLSKKKVAVVDFQGAGDGATWASNRMIADSGQIRFGVGGKGSVFVFDGKNVGDFGSKSGIADANGHVMMRGPDGKMFDVSGYDMIIPLDAIKNQGAYKDENGNFYSGERSSEIATALARRYGIGMVANYSKEDISSDKIGTQMASFINFNPAVRDRQIELAMARMRELETESGQLKYVFGNDNDWLSRKVKEDPQLLNTEMAKRRVDNYKQSLMNRIVGGEYINFGEDSGIADMRLAASPLASYLMSHGGIKDGKVLPETIAKAREYLGNESEKYTDEQISNMIVPDENTVLDFAHKEKDHVAVIRSPTGYGNMVHAKNVAAAAEPIYKGFGIATDAGIYVSDKHLKPLQSADYDADQAKVIYDDELRKSVEETLKTQHFEEASVPSKTVEYSKKELADPAVQQTYFANRGAAMSAAMGAGASGIRIMQLDLSKQSNQQFIKEAQRLANYYDTWTTHNKSAEEADIKDADAWGTFKLAKEYTKFSDNIQKFIMKEDEIPEELSESDIYKAENGKYVNLKALRELGVDNVNLPAAYMANHLIGVAAQNKLYRSGGVDTTYMDAIGEAMEHMGYGDAGPARQKLMKTMRSLLPQFGTGERAMLTPEETRALQSMEEQAMQELIADSRQYLNPASGKFTYTNERGEIKEYKTAEDLAEARAKNYGIITARNAIGSFGMTQDRLRHVFGENYDKNFVNATASTIELLPEDKEKLEYAQKEEDINKRIEEKEEKIRKAKSYQAKKSNKKEVKRASVKQQLLDREIETLEHTLHVDADTDIDKEIESEKIYARSADEGSQLKASEDRISGLEKYKNLIKKRGSLNNKSTDEQELEALYAEQAKLKQAREENLKAIEMRTEYQQLLSDAEEYNSELWGFQKGKENKINDSKSFAEKYWGRSYYQSLERTKPLGEFEKRMEESTLDEDHKQEMRQGIANARFKIEDNIQKDFANKSILYAKELSENLTDELDKQQNALTPQKRKINQYDESIENAKSFSSLMRTRLEKGKVDPIWQKLYEESIEETDKYIEAAEKSKQQLIEEYTKQNEKAGRKTVNGLYEKYGLKSKNSLATRVEARKDEIQSVRDIIGKKHEEGYYTDDEYNEISAQLDDLEQKSTKVSVATQDMMNKVGDVVNNLAHRLTHQLFQRALQETKRFIKEFDSSMNEIQAITLKSDSEMQGVRSQTVNKAIGLRTSVSNVATTEAALYRQGLSDAEVSSRTDSIIKFATVTKLNVAEATKIITTALQNDLVPSAEQAMDALVALGDSAATTAAEIGKGMQKAAASAKVAGVSYAELTALLTIGTSDTQLSGTQVGTALQTVFSRMRRLSISGYTADQNGEKTTASDAEAALKSVGVDLWDDKTIGKMRSAYDVLSDLSKVWQNLSDAQKNIVMNALAGTRQTNVFSTLMEGMSEDGGATLDKYLGLAEGSEGITQTKYEIAMQSLAASMDTVRSSWDSVVESMVNGGSVTGILDSVSGFLQMFANAGDIGQGMSLVAGGIVGIGVALASIANTNPVIKALSTVFGLAAGLITAGGISAFANLFNPESEDERKARESQEAWSSIQKSYSYTKSDESSINKAITEVEKAGKAWKELDNETNTDNLVIALGNLGNAFPAVSDSVKDAIADLNNWTKAVDDAKEKADQFTKGNIENQIDKIVGYIDEYTPQNYNAAMKRFASQADLRNAGTYLANGVGKEASFWGYGGGLIDRYNKGWLDYNLDVDKLMQSGNENDKAKALVYGYRNSEEFRKVVNSVITNKELLSDLGGKTNADDLLKAGDFASRASNALDLVMQKSGAVDALSLEVLADTLGITKQELTEFNDTTGLSSQKKFYKLATNNSGVRSWIQENNPALYSQFFDENGNPTSFFEDVVRNPSDNEAKAINQMYTALINEAKQGDVEYNTKRKQAALAFFNEDLSSRMPFEEMATEEYDSEFLKNLFIKSLGESGIVDEYGDYNKDALKAFVVNFLNGWKDGTGNALNEYVEKNADYSDFKYYIDKTDRNTWFNNYEDAIQYARRNKIDYNEIKGQNGESAYQSAAKTTDALLATKDADKTARNLNTALDVIRNVSSLQELQSEYDKLGLGQELTNVLGSNNTLLGLFEMMRNDIISYSEFQDYASDLSAGRTNRAGLVSSIYENLISGDLSVKDFRSLPAYSELYKTFSSIVGDSADAVLNAIEDGVKSADLTNAFNKSIIEQRIKEAMPASNYLSEAIAYATTMTTGTALQQQEYNANKTKSDTEFANYAAAINRYISGNAKPEDYATIAAMGDFSETALRNGVDKSAVRASYNTRVQARTDQLNAELQGALASLGIEGLTLNEYLAQVANREEDVYKFSELELKDEFEQAKHNLPLGIETFDQYANWRNIKIGTRSVSHKVPRSNAVDQLLANYSVDENGNLVYTPRKEEYLSPEAVLRDEKGEQASTNRARYLLISDAIAQGRNINSFLSDKSYSEILQQDDTLRRMIVAGAGNDAVGNYVNRQLTGQQGTFQDNYGWVMSNLFGGTDTSKWSAEAIRTQWTNAQNNPELLQFYNEMLSSMAGGDIIKQIAQGGEGNLDEAIELYLKDYYTQLSNKYGSEFAQAIGLNQATLATGNASERLRLLSGFNQNIAQGENAQYYLNNWSSQSAGILSSYLGMTEEEVKQADRTELQDAINQSVKEEIIRQAESYGAKLEGINIDTSSLSDVRAALEASLSSLSGDAKAFVENLIEQIDKTGNVVGKASKSLDEVVQDTQQQMQEGTYEYQALDFMRRNADTAYVRSKENGISTIDAFGRLAGWNQEWNSVVGSNQGLIAASSLYQNGTITGQQYQDFLGMQMSGAGKNSDYYSMLAGAALGQGFQNGQFTSVEALQAGIANAKGNENLLNFYTELSSKYGEFLSQIENGDHAEEALKRLNEQWTQDKISNLTKWLKNGSQAAQTLTALKKGGKDSAQAIASLRKEASQLNNAAVAIESSAGKSGKQLSQNERSDLASVTGEDENLIKEMTKEQVEKLRQRAQESIDQSFVEDFGNAIATQLNNLMAEKPVDFEMAVKAHVGADGQLDLSEISAIADQLNDETLAILASHAGTIGQLFVELKKEGLSETAIAKVVAGSVKGTGKRIGGGGGGGGGKSAADKLLESQKRKVSEIQHDQKMLEIEEKNYDRYNNDEAYRANINEQIKVQQRLADQYSKNIQEIENMRKSTKEGSDDWNKLTDSLMSAQEAFAGIAEAVDNLYSKMDAQLKQLYEYNSALLKHKTTMSEIDFTFYQNVNDPENAIAEIEKQLGLVAETELNDRTRRQEIANSMEDEFLRNGESDRYRELLGERDSLTEKIAKSVNDRFTLDAQRLDVQKKYQQNTEIPYTHDLNTINAQMQRAELDEDMETYKRLFEQRQQIWKAEEDRNNAYIAELELLMAYYNSVGQTQNALSTLQEINSLQEENDDLFNQRLQARKDNLQKEQDATRESLNRQTMKEDHQNSGYAQMANAYKRAGDHGSYRQMLSAQIENWKKMITVQKQLLKIEVEKLKTMVKETEEYYKQLELIYEIEGKITELEANIANAEMDMMDDRIDEIIEGIDRINDLSNHIQKLIKDQQQMYQNQGNWDAYFVMAEKRRQELLSNVADMTAQAAQLKSEMATVPYGGSAWENLRSKVLSLEETISSARVELENFDREIEGIKVNRLLEELNRNDSDRAHNITLMQYEQTRYQNAGELTNYGIMLQKEIDYRKENSEAMEEELLLLKEEIENLNLSEKDFYRLTEAIKKKEEALSQNNVAIEKNTKLLRQNEQAIRKTRLDLEQMVLKVIEDNIKKEKDMLNNTVEMENIILDVIKRRYQDEWKLIQQDEEKKREALEKEKQLINERLNYRKQAMEAENKYSELAEYQRQLALISADPTRSKESKELSRKIDELRQDIRWDEASQQAEAATERIEDEINAINEYVQIHSENLNEMLLDANNFAAEVKEVLSRSYGEIVLWLQQNDIDYQNSLDDRKKQMEQGWKETWMAMKGIVETYWDQIEDILSSEDRFMQYMYENSLDYANASVTGQLQLASQWEDGWTNAANAVNQAIQAINYTPDIHEDFTPPNADQALQEALDWGYDDSWYNVGGSYGPTFTTFEDVTQHGLDKPQEEEQQPEEPQEEQQPEASSSETSSSEGSNLVPPSEYAGNPEPNIQQTPTTTPTPSQPTSTGSHGGGGGGSSQGQGSLYDVYDERGFLTNYHVTASSATEAQNIVRETYGGYYSASPHSSLASGVSSSSSGSVSASVSEVNHEAGSFFNTVSNAFENVANAIQNEADKFSSAVSQLGIGTIDTSGPIHRFASGGIVDYTGPAWVDGTRSRPEAFLDPYDTENIRALTDALNYIRVEPFYVPNTDTLSGNTQSIGDINITINGAEMKDDADYEDVARRVGQAFTRELQKEGLNLARYSF